MTKPKLLWVGDACCPTGFARVTHNVIPYIQEKFDIAVLGINYNGDPHQYNYPIYPARTSSSHDQWGLGRLDQVLKLVQPDIVMVNNDPWNVIRFPSKVKVPVVAYMPVDAPNMKEEIAKGLDDLALAIFYTQFGVDVAKQAGYDKLSAIIPHGADTELYRPIDKAIARKTLGLEGKIPDDAFIVGNVNRNQPRKRLDLTIMAFASWIEKYGVPDDVFLLLHCGLNDVGWDLGQLATYFGLDNRVIFTDIKLAETIGVDEVALPYVYNSFDVQVSTTMGEGWGLTTMEGMACGIPQIVPDWSALGEWANKAAKLVPISGIQVTCGKINTLGAVIDEEAFIRALNEMYIDKSLRNGLGIAGYNLVHEPRFQWSAIGRFMAYLLEDVLSKPRLTPYPTSKSSPTDPPGALETVSQGAN